MVSRLTWINEKFKGIVFHTGYTEDDKEFAQIQQDKTGVITYRAAEHGLSFHLVSSRTAKTLREAKAACERNLDKPQTRRFKNEIELFRRKRHA